MNKTKIRIKKVVCIFILCMPFLAFASDFDYAAYKQSTIQEIIERHKRAECQSSGPQETTYSAYAYKYKIMTIFSNELRPINESTKKFLENYGKAFQWNRNLIETYKHEILIQDKGKTYWIPVQEQFIPAMRKELKAGQRFELYLAVLGGTNNQCIFVATEFNANP